MPGWQVATRAILNTVEIFFIFSPNLKHISNLIRLEKYFQN